MNIKIYKCIDRMANALALTISIYLSTIKIEKKYYAVVQLHVHCALCTVVVSDLCVF